MLARTHDLIRHPCFYWQYIIGVVICWGVNFGFEWATLTHWGQHPLEDIYFTKVNSETTFILIDFIITGFLVGFLTVLLSTSGIKVGLCVGGAQGLLVEFTRRTVACLSHTACAQTNFSVGRLHHSALHVCPTRRSVVLL